jgi:hypothetical protein
MMISMIIPDKTSNKRVALEDTAALKRRVILPYMSFVYNINSSGDKLILILGDE